MVGRRVVLASLVLALLPAGCGLLAAVPAEPVGPAPTPIATDAPAPYTLRAAVEPARRFLEGRWAALDEGPATFRFLEGRCALGAAAVLVFAQVQPAAPETFALAFSHDIAAGIISDAWGYALSVEDPDANARLQELLGGREIPCP